MLRSDVIAYAQAKLSEHGLDAKGWTFKIDDRPRKLGGCCYYGPRRVCVSGWLVDHNPPAQVYDTVLHEIAHALAGNSAGHGPVWKQWCVKIGARPEMYYRSECMNKPTKKWVTKCEKCGGVYEHLRHAPKRVVCKCNPAVVLKWTLEGRYIRTATHEDVGGGIVKRAAQTDAPPLVPMQVGPEIASLLSELGNLDPWDNSDVTRGKSIRAKLRRLGHKGGLQ